MLKDFRVMDIPFILIPLAVLVAWMFQVPMRSEVTDWLFLCFIVPFLYVMFWRD